MPTGVRVVTSTASGLHQPFALCFLPGQLALTADRFGLFACLAHGWLFEVLLELHLTEHALTLKLFLQCAECLIDVVITNTNLHVVYTTFLIWICNKLQEVGV